MIPYGRQHITEQDIAAVVDVLRSDYLTQGPKVGEFEQALSQKVGAKYGVAVNSATSALHIACLALGVGEGDIVWTSPISFVASANCALYCGAQVGFVDIDQSNGNLCVAALQKKLALAAESNSLPKVIIPVHLAGQSCNMQAIHALARAYDIKIIEDASHAVGGKYQQSYVGNCQYSDITVFSFHPVKIITSAEGGLATTNCKELHQKMALFRSHGITRDDSLMQGENHGPWYYQQVELGFNYRMTELQAALGVNQMNYLDDLVAKRNQQAQFYHQHLTQNVKVLAQEPDCYNSYHLFIIKVPAQKRAQIFNALRTAQIGVNVHYIPIHLQPYYQNLGFKVGDFPQAESFYSSIISIPLFPDMTEAQQSYIVETVNQQCDKE